MIRINTVEDIQNIQENILGQLVQGKLTYFSLIIGEDGEASSCFFTPTSKLKDGQSMIMVEDYEKLLRVLLCHPMISDIEYNEKENCISAVFESPYPADRGDEDLILEP